MMAETATVEAQPSPAPATLTLDAVVTGAGVAGLYELHLLREQGLSVKAFDSASDVGGTWYWNRYPGARFDSEACIYQYLFSEDLYKGWSWSEKFPGQPGIERWMHYVADRLDLRKDIVFNTTITSARFDEETERWTITTDKGQTIDAQFLITCCGMLPAPLTHVFPGQDSFEGQPLFTAKWPKEPVDLAGKRLGEVLKTRVFEPLGMEDTTFTLTGALRSRLADVNASKADGSLAPMGLELPSPPEVDMGGHGLYSTVGDDMRFIRMWLNDGAGEHGRVLKSQTVRIAEKNQLGDLKVTMLPGVIPSLSNDAEFFPGLSKSWALTFMVNDEQAPTGRPAGALGWAGRANLFY